LSAYAPFIGSSFDFSMQVTQTGNTVSSMMGSCSYTGTATVDGFTLSISPGPCTQIDQRGVIVCSNGAARYSQLVSSVLSFTVNGNTAKGIRTETTNVIAAFENGVAVGPVVGAVVTSESITVSR